jgi:hypothetical protein
MSVLDLEFLHLGGLYEVMKSIPKSPEGGRVKIAQHGSALYLGAEPNAGLPCQ